MENSYVLPVKLHRNPWIPDLSQAVLLISLAYCLRDFFVCYDALWQVKIGEWIWQNKSMPRFDPGFAISSAPIPWKDHQWLGQLILYGLWNIGGFLGLRVILGLIPALIFSRVFVLLRRQGVSPLSAFFFTLVAAVSSAHHWLARPHLIAYVLLILGLLLWEKVYSGDRKSAFLLALIHIAWVNMHQSFMIQFVFAAAFGFQVAVEFFQKPAARRPSGLNVAVLIILLPLVSSLNPHGFDVLKSSESVWAIHNRIEEWQPVHLNSKNFPAFFLYSLILLWAMWRDRKNVKPFECVIFTATVLLTATAVRQLPIFVLSTLPSYVRHLPSLSTKALGGRIIRWWNARNEAIHVCEKQFSGGRLVMLIVIMLLLVSIAGFHNQAAANIVWNGLNGNFLPIAACDFLEKEGIKGNIFNVYAWGGYLIFRFGDSNKLFIDGRTDMYGPGRLEEYHEVYEIPGQWETIFEKYSIEIVLENTEQSLCRKLLAHPRWSLVYSDKQASVFVSKEKFPGLVRKYPNVSLAQRTKKNKGMVN
ncbi:MAG: hypothetical protein HY587_01025 [Candidatus Omnitrophica bacterium]|nr:hypothetical protein [Candidatus Omnitrophota bacterium]